jgi:hypothetical protein
MGIERGEYGVKSPFNKFPVLSLRGESKRGEAFFM